MQGQNDPVCVLRPYSPPPAGQFNPQGQTPPHHWIDSLDQGLHHSGARLTSRRCRRRWSGRGRSAPRGTAARAARTALPSAPSSPAMVEYTTGEYDVEQQR